MGISFQQGRILQISIWVKFKQLSRLNNQVLFGSLTKAIAIQQEHIVLALGICRFLFKIAPNMLKGIANLTSMLRDLTGTVDHLLNHTQLHNFLLEILANIIVNVARMTQDEVFVSSPELLAKGTLVVIIHN